MTPSVTTRRWQEVSHKFNFESQVSAWAPMNTPEVNESGQKASGVLFALEGLSAI